MAKFTSGLVRQSYQGREEKKSNPIKIIMDP